MLSRHDTGSTRATSSWPPAYGVPTGEQHSGVDRLAALAPPPTHNLSAGAPRCARAPPPAQPRALRRIDRPGAARKGQEEGFWKVESAHAQNSQHMEGLLLDKSDA